MDISKVNIEFTEEYYGDEGTTKAIYFSDIESNKEVIENKIKVRIDEDLPYDSDIYGIYLSCIPNNLEKIKITNGDTESSPYIFKMKYNSNDLEKMIFLHSQTSFPIYIVFIFKGNDNISIPHFYVETRKSKLDKNKFDAITHPTSKTIELKKNKYNEYIKNFPEVKEKIINIFYEDDNNIILNVQCDMTYKYGMCSCKYIYFISETDKDYNNY